MARLLTRGTRRFSAERLDEMVAGRGGSLEGYGGRNSFGVSARFLSADLPLALDLIGEVLAAPSFPEKEFAQARRLALAGLQQRRERISEDNRRLLDRLLYEPHPYCRQPEGTEESLGRLARADVAAVHTAFCRPDNMVLCVAGDVSAERVHALVLRSMKDFLAPRPPPFSPPEVPAVPALRGARTERESRPGARQAIVSLAFRGVSLRDPDRFALDGLRAVLSGMGSRLFTELRDRQSLAYSVGCYLDQGLDPGAFVFHIATRPDQVDRTLEAFWTEIEKVKTLPVADEELERAKNSLLGREIVSRQGLLPLAQGLAYRELYGLGAESFFEDHRAIEKLTAADLLAAARRYLDAANYVVAITAPEVEPAPSAAGANRQEPAP
jgi:zinc protease